MADKRVLIELVNMLSGTLQGIGQQRQQRSRDKAGMQMDRARMEMQEKQFDERMANEAERIKTQNKYHEALIKQGEIQTKIAEQGAADRAAESEYIGDVRGGRGEFLRGGKDVQTLENVPAGAKALGEGVAGLGPISAVSKMMQNIPGAIQAAEPGTKRESWGSFEEWAAQSGLSDEVVSGVWESMGVPFLTEYDRTLRDLNTKLINEDITCAEYKNVLLKYASEHPEWQQPGFGLIGGSRSSGRRSGGGAKTTPDVDLNAIFGPPGDTAQETNVITDQIRSGILSALDQGVNRAALEADLVETYGLSDADAKALLDEISGSSE